MRNNLAKAPRPRANSWLAPTLAALFLPAALHAQEPAQPPAPTVPDPLVVNLIEAHNKERAKEGLPPLKFEPRLEEAAKAHAKDMADRDVMTHEGGDGSTPSQRVVKVGYHYLTTGENVAEGYSDVSKVMQGWMDSPPHKKNILGDFTEIGVARAANKDGKPYWCADFGKPIPKYDPATASADLVKRINDERTQEQVPALEVNPKLAKFAQEQAAGLTRKKADGGGTASFEGFEAKLYADLAMSTAVGQPDAAAVIKSLMRGEQLKAQILGKFTRIGIGYATAEDGTPFWCLILANPKNR